MKLILVTSPNYFVEEDKIVTALFEEGLDILHLYKNDTAPIYAERLLTLLPDQYLKRIVAHENFYLKEEYKLKGVHINTPNPVAPPHYKGHLSCTCHTLEEVKAQKKNSDYLFFDNIPMEGQPSDYTAEDIRKAHKSGIIDKRVIACGNINEDNLKLMKEYGFGGVAIREALWDKFDTCLDRDFDQVIEHFKILKKLID